MELSCNDLIGASLFDLATGNVSGEVVTSTDCDQVAEAMLATEMRALPTQCNFPLVLQPDAPELSDILTKSSTVLRHRPRPGLGCE